MNVCMCQTHRTFWHVLWWKGYTTLRICILQNLLSMVSSLSEARHKMTSCKYVNVSLALVVFTCVCALYLCVRVYVCAVYIIQYSYLYWIWFQRVFHAWRFVFIKAVLLVCEHWSVTRAPPSYFHCLHPTFYTQQCKKKHRSSINNITRSDVVKRVIYLPPSPSGKWNLFKYVYLIQEHTSSTHCCRV